MDLLNILSLIVAVIVGPGGVYEPPVSASPVVMVSKQEVYVPQQQPSHGNKAVEVSEVGSGSVRLSSANARPSTYGMGSGDWRNAGTYTGSNTSTHQVAIRQMDGTTRMVSVGGNTNTGMRIAPRTEFTMAASSDEALDD